jgi:exonuclease VII large subunit
MDVAIANLIANCVVVVVLIWVIIGFKKRLDTQKEMLADHNKMLEGARVFLEFANPKNLMKTAEDIVKLKEARIKEESEDKIRKERENTRKFLEQQVDNLNKSVNELLAATGLAYSLLYYVHPDDRKVALKNAEAGLVKQKLLKDIESWPYAKHNILIDLLSTHTKPEK